MKKMTVEIEPPRQIEGRCLVEGINIAYRQIINSPKTIVFLHGNSAGKEVFSQQFEALSSSSYSLIAIDFPGHGDSDHSTDVDRHYNFPALALIVKKVLEQLNVENPIVVGWSLGGHVAIEMAGRGFPMAGIMIFGTPPLGPGLQEYEAAFLPSEAMQVTLKEERTEADVLTYMKGLYGTATQIPEQFMQLAQKVDPRMPAKVGEHWGAGDHGCHQQTVICGWQGPICILHGLKDQFVSNKYMSALPQDNLWDGGLIEMPDVGHAPFWEAPETFNLILLEFAESVFA